MSLDMCASFLLGILAFQSSLAIMLPMQDQSFDIKIKTEYCNGTRSLMPMSSWGFSEACCDVFPRRGELRDLEDKNYFRHQTIRNGSIVYVFIVDLPEFIDKIFVKLPLDYHINLVTGNGDFSAPYEAMSLHGGRMGRASLMSMRDFLDDPRLNRWFAQNYDLFGCGGVTMLCCDITADEILKYSKKVLPLPIGLDFHSKAGKRDTLAQNYQYGVCLQRLQLEALQQSNSFAEKSSLMVVSFDCSFSDEIDYRRIARRDLCSLIKENSDLVLDVSKESRDVFWETMKHHSFALAPQGRGIDTHRFWEILQLRSVPIVLSSPLDRLYESYPVVIVKSWSQAFNSSYLSEVKWNLRSKFGSNAFNENLLGKMTMKYWIAEARKFNR